MRSKTISIQESTKLINEFRIAYPEFSSEDFNFYVKSSKIKYYVHLFSKFVHYGIVIRIERGHYRWSNEPLHIKKFEFILDEIRTEMKIYNQNQVAKKEEVKPSTEIEPLEEVVVDKTDSIDVNALVAFLSEAGYIIDGRHNIKLTEETAIQVAKLLGYRIFKKVEL